MPLHTPFHDRLVPLNETGLWRHWSGHLVAPQYQYSLTNEYYAVRNAVSLLDTSPLFKYRFKGPDARTLLERLLARDIGACREGRAQYTCWLDERGFVIQDGVVMQVRPDEYWLTAAEPALRYFRREARERGLTGVDIDDVSADFGILALQGPHAHDVLARLTDAATPLRYFSLAHATVAGCGVVISRTGYTGDLGYELWIRAGDAVPVWDALMAEGDDFNIVPIGTTALRMVRIEAGLLLIHVDFQTSQFAWVDAQRETPLELGWTWMFPELEEDERDFVGRAALESARTHGTSRWTTVGLGIDWHHYQELHAAAGVLAPMHEIYSESTKSIYRRGAEEWDYAGYATSFSTSSLLRRPIAIAKLPLDLVEPGTEVDLEISIIKKPVNVLARVERTPFFNPPRKTASMAQAAAS